MIYFILTVLILYVLIIARMISPGDIYSLNTSRIRFEVLKVHKGFVHLINMDTKVVFNIETKEFRKEFTRV